jgi:hypothetical protein
MGKAGDTRRESRETDFSTEECHVNQERLGELPLAELTNDQLQQVQQAEEKLNQDGKNIYLIAFEKQAPSQ